MQSLLSSKNVTWVTVALPEAEELTTLVREAQLLPLDAEFIAQNFHRPEVTVRPDYVLILLQVPVFNKILRVTTNASLYFIIKENQLWTLHYENIVVMEKLVKDFTDNPDKQTEYFGDGALGLALYLISSVMSSSFVKLERLHKHISIAEDAVFQGNERKMVEEVSILSRDVMDFRKVIRPQQKLFASVPNHPFFIPPLAALWLRLDGQANKAWDILESLSESIRELRQTNNNLLQYKESQLLQLLTYYSILSIPVFIILSPINPRAEGATIFEIGLYWGLLAALILILVFIFLRFKGKRIL